MSNFIEIVKDILFDTNWKTMWPDILQSIKAIPFAPFYLLQIIIATIGDGLQDITKGLITNEMIGNIIAFIGGIGSLFVIK